MDDENGLMMAALIEAIPDTVSAEAATFRTGLKATLEKKKASGKKLKSREKKALEFLNEDPPKKNHAKKLNKWETHAAAEFFKRGETPRWGEGEFDFDKFWERIMEIFSWIMKLFGLAI